MSHDINTVPLARKGWISNATLPNCSRQPTCLRATCTDYARYEAQKAEWVTRNPGATTAQYEAAVRATAKACGV
jgi:hypothetical protein